MRPLKLTVAENFCGPGQRKRWTRDPTQVVETVCEGKDTEVKAGDWRRVQEQKTTALVGYLRLKESHVNVLLEAKGRQAIFMGETGQGGPRARADETYRDVCATSRGRGQRHLLCEGRHGGTPAEQARAAPQRRWSMSWHRG